MHWIYKMVVVYIPQSVCLRLSQSSQLYFMSAHQPEWVISHAIEQGGAVPSAWMVKKKVEGGGGGGAIPRNLPANLIYGEGGMSLAVQ